jgi:hypothetical protein
MAGSEHRPTDDVEGHMPKRYGLGGQDTEAVDEDQVGDDTEGHASKARLGLDSEATDDVQGHAGRYGGRQHIDANDDVEGHVGRWGQDTEAVDEDQAGGDDA